MRTIPARTGVRSSPTKRVLTPVSPEFATSSLAQLEGVAAGTAAWTSANDPFAIPFVLSTPITVTELGWLNGTGTMTDSFDIGIYTTSWAKIISTGGTARVGVTDWQWVNVADTLLPADRYYLAMVSNGVTANQFYSWTALTAPVYAFLGCQDSATDAYPLPDPLTNMAENAVSTKMPVVAIVTGPRFS